MAKAPKEPKEGFEEFVSDCKKIFGDDLVSIILYGSAAEGNYRPGKSDINFLVVLTEDGIDALDRALKKTGKWRKRNIATPLFLSGQYIQTSVDAYPLEYLNFQRHYQVVFGRDVLRDLMVDRSMLRLQCEREVKGKLLLLRRTFLETEGKARALKTAIGFSLTAFIAIFEGLLFLRGHDPIKDRKERIRRVCEDFGLDHSLFITLLEVKEDRLKVKDEQMRELFKRYLKQIRELASKVDSMEV